MRYLIIILSFALALSAAPVPQDQARAIRYKNSRDVEGLEADLEARALRPSTSMPQDEKREAEAEPARFRPITREAEAEAARFRPITREAEAEAARFRPITREAEAEPARFRPITREAEAEPARFRPITREAEAEAEPIIETIHNEQREAQRYRPITREAEAEPIIETIHNERREAQRYRPITREAEAGGRFRPVGRSERSVVDISLRDIYNSARGMKSAIVEALKGRGFNSATLLEPM